MGESISGFKVDGGGFVAEALLQKLGDHYLLSLRGGAAHIGAVAMARPRPGLADPARLSSTASIFCQVGHTRYENLARSGNGMRHDLSFSKLINIQVRAWPNNPSKAHKRDIITVH